MTTPETLTDLGFSAEAVSERKGLTTYRIRTSKGWTYEKFAADAEDAVRAWAKAHEPG